MDNLLEKFNGGIAAKFATIIETTPATSNVWLAVGNARLQEVDGGSLLW